MLHTGDYRQYDEGVEREQMAVLASESGMTSDSKDHNDSCQEFNLYVDRQLQNKLLQVDDDIELYEIKLSQSGNYQRNGAKTIKIDVLSGWYSDAKFTARKNEGATKIDAKPANIFMHSWKERGTKKEESFVFKHYTDHKKYIEQYRSEHGCLNIRYPSGNQIGDMQRVAFQGRVTVQQMQQNLTSPNTPLALQYSNRVKEQLGTLMSPSTPINSNYYNIKSNPVDCHLSSLQHRYKLTPGHFSRTNTCSEMRNHGQFDKFSEYGEYQQTGRRSNSATSVRGPQKDPTKIAVPASSRAHHSQALAIQQSVKQDLCPSPKPLDNLNCVAPDIQNQLHSHSELDGLTWSEKLEALRSINKPVDKPKTKLPKLKFVKEDPDGILVLLTEQEQLYEQRRIRHLVEQARIKGGKQYDWLCETPNRTKCIDWNTSKLKEHKIEKEDRDDINEHSSDNGDEIHTQETENDRKLRRYGIYISPKGVKHGVFSVHDLQRSKTYIAE